MNRRKFIKSAILGIGAITVPLVVKAEQPMTLEEWFASCEVSQEIPAAAVLDEFYIPEIAERAAHIENQRH